MRLVASAWRHTAHRRRCPTRRLATLRLVAGTLAAVVAVDTGVHAAPQAPEQRSVFRAGTDLVRVDVTVTGRDDAPVTDLKPADFEVTEDDAAQRVEAVHFVRVDGTRTSDLDEPLEIRSREHARREAERDDVRLFAIFLDDYHLAKSPAITRRVRDALTTFIKQLGPNDLFVLMDPLTTLRDLKFTRSKGEALQRIRTFEGRRGEGIPARSAVEEEQLSRPNWMELRSGVTLSALHELATHVGGLREGRTSILFVSHGPMARPGSPNWQTLRDATRAAQQGNVTVHAFDPRPFGAVGMANLMRDIAADTGGRAIVNLSNPDEQLAGVIADASAYYVIGYQPTRPLNDGKFHEINVRVKRRGVRVTARRGYWAASEQALAAAAQAATRPVNVALTAALAALTDPTAGRAVALWSGFSKGDGDLTRVTMTYEPTSPRAMDTPARLDIQPLDEGGQVVGVPQSIGGAPGQLPLVAANDVPPGRHRIRVSAFSAGGELLDRWVQTQNVPDFSQAALALATPRVLRATSAADARAMEASPAPPPSSSRRFAPGDRVVVQFEVSGSAAARARIAVELLNGQGDVLRPLEAPSVTGGSARLPLPVGSLANGTYVLKIVAAADEHRAEQWLAFRVGR